MAGLSETLKSRMDLQTSKDNSVLPLSVPPIFVKLVKYLYNSKGFFVCFFSPQTFKRETISLKQAQELKSGRGYIFKGLEIIGS